MKTRRNYNGLKLKKLMELAREIWGRDPSIVSAQRVEGRRFREFFGCSALVALSAWRKLQLSLQIPYGGKPNHLLWALLFMKVYPKENVMCSLIHVKDPKTFRGKVKAFISAIADLQADIVSDLFFLLFLYYMHIFLALLFNFRFNSITGIREI